MMLPGGGIDGHDPLSRLYNLNITLSLLLGAPFFFLKLRKQELKKKGVLTGGANMVGYDNSLGVEERFKEPK